MEEYVNNEEELYNDLDNLKLNISDHCLDRYSERIMGRPIVGNDAIEKATNEIKKLYLSSEVYYVGIIGRSQNPVQVRCNRNGWILIVTKDGKTLITLYKVDLMVDSDEVNQLYVDKALEKIKALKENYDKVLEESLIESEKCDNEINEINNQISEYETLIKQLKDRKNTLHQLKDNIPKVKSAEVDLRNALQDFIVKDKLKIEDNVKY